METDLGIQRESGEPLPGLAGTTCEMAHLAHDARGERDQVAGRKPVARAPGVARQRAERGRADQVRPGGGHQPTLGQPAPLALPGDLHETVLFERPEVVVDVLPGESYARRECRRRDRFGHFREQPGPLRVQSHRGGARLFDDRDIEHRRGIRSLTNIVVNRHSIPLRRRREHRAFPECPAGACGSSRR